MSKRRSRLEIIADILSVVKSNDNAGKTRIMYQTNLSWKLLNQYLNNLAEAGLLTSGNSRCYILTLKGRRFLNRVAQYSKSREEVETLLDVVENEKAVLEKICFGARAHKGE